MKILRHLFHTPLLCLSITIFFLFAGGINTAIADDLTVIKNRIIEPLKTPPDRGTVDNLFDTLRPDGSWPSVDYADTNGGNWKTSGHLSRLLTLSSAWASSKTAQQTDANLQKAVFSALDFWLDNDFTNRNWWWNQIGVPGRLSQCLLLLDSDLSNSQRKKGVTILERSKIRMTGANLVDVAFITVERGILEKKADVVAEAVRKIADEIRITTDEGIQPDFSFHQHGELLYNHGYGAVFMTKCSELAVLVTGTQFALPKEKTDILSVLVLDGTRWMIRYSTKDYGATGRGISRRAGNNDSAGYLRGVIGNMLEIPTSREQEFRDMLAYLDGESGPPLIGNRHFWRSDIMTHHRRGWYASARMFSNRLLNTDRPHNGEGLRSHHLADGCTYIMQNGREYHDIFPVWDWQKIPGTTIEQKPELAGDICRKGTRSFAGGVSDGMYGAAAFDFELDGLTARKSWFFFDNEFVCLGAGIQTSSAHPVLTTVNQCYMRGSVLVPDGRLPKALPYGHHKLDGIRFVYHNDIAYVFPDNQYVRLENNVRTGSWRNISTQFPPETISHDVFTLWIDHGAQPANGSYEYIVAPGMTAESVMEYARKPPVVTVSNTPQLQAVRHKDLDIIGAAFYEPGQFTAGKVTASVDKPCLLLMQFDGNTAEVTVSNPENKEAGVTVSISIEGKGQVQAGFNLPGGPDVGKSVSKTLSLQ
ncbi:polysaccharide lyase 8 family protein [Candidatus Omnitrophota bacterium]